MQLGDVARPEGLPFPGREAFREAWDSMVEATPGAGVFASPRLIPKGTFPLQIGDSLAILAPKAVRLHPAPGWTTTITGWRLVGNRLLGVEDVPTAIQAAEAMEKALDKSTSEVIIIEDLNIVSPLAIALATLMKDGRALVFPPSAPQSHWWIDFPEAADLYWNKFSSKSRKNLRRQVRNLEHKLRVICQPDQVAEFLTSAQFVSQRSWQGRRYGLRVQATPEKQAFWMEVARMGALRSYILEQGDRPIAFVLGVQWQGEYSYEEVAYDSEFAEASPGTVLLVRILEDLFDSNTPERLDFGTGDADYKRHFGTSSSLSGSFHIVRRQWRSRVLFGLDTWTQRLGKLARSGLNRFGGKATLRRLYRRS